MFRNPSRLLFSLIPGFAIAAFFLGISSISGCRPAAEDEPPVIEEPIEPERPAFAWDTVRRSPRWRLSSPIRWYTSDDRIQVISESRSSGKPILCYVSRYDRDLTATIEDGLFVADAWGATIMERFIPWEIDWWEDPEYARTALGEIAPPALAVLAVSPDEGTDEFRRIDSWAGSELLSFPLHEGILPLSNPSAHETLAGFAEVRWEDLSRNEIPRGIDVDPVLYAKELIDSLRQRVEQGLGLLPEEALLLAYDALARDTEAVGLEERIAAWKAYAEQISDNVVWLPDDAFGTDWGWGIDLNRNMHAAACAVSIEVAWPVAPGVLFAGLDGLIRFEDGELGGGFPPYVDVRGIFNPGRDFIDDEQHVLPSASEFEDAQPGPRDVVWINARTLAWWLRLIKWNPDLASHAFPGGASVDEFLGSTAKKIIDALESRAGDPEEMRFVDKIYILDLYNEIYQLTGDVDYLEKAGPIADSFPEDRADEWLDPAMGAFLPDLALALHCYGWLAEEEDARAVAKVITETVVGYAMGQSALFDATDRARLALACEVVNSKCLHVSVVAPVDDPVGLEILWAGLRGWDPRKVVQILDPERDAELLEKKFLFPQETAVAFVCLDNMCYPRPIREAGNLGDLLAEATADLAAESGD